MSELLKESPVDLNTRLRIATRIHFALLRNLGEGVDVAAMLKNEEQAREVLWVCEASGDEELVALGRQFQRAVTLEEEARTAAGHATQDTPWARDTSGFGVSQAPDMAELGGRRASIAPTLTAAVRQRGEARGAAAWLNPVNWLRRGQH
jgi:hypothetical protein